MVPKIVKTNFLTDKIFNISSSTILNSELYLVVSIWLLEMIIGPSFLTPTVYLNCATNSPFFSARMG
jgi:hypothetical protein